MDFLDRFKDKVTCAKLLDQLEQKLSSPFRFMEVCGTHTVAIFRSGLRSLLPDKLIHLSGPGCPVCVTHEREVAGFFELAKRKRVILVTFGDLLRIPGPRSQTLKDLQAQGARIKVVYSPLDSLEVAKDNPSSEVVFLGVGFETTAPTIAASLQLAKSQGLTNFSVFCLHKLVPPALKVLLEDEHVQIDGFLLPGHVSVIIGLQPYEFLSSRYHLPAVVGGFEPLDIVQALLTLVSLNPAQVVNCYPRAVKPEGNEKALKVMQEVFEVGPSLWRGIGLIAQSGLKLRGEWAEFDAQIRFGLTELPEVEETKGCRCGEVLRGILRPNECPLFAKACNPEHPIGPCMVSSEGSCAAYYKYEL